jgi:type I restriction enzyme R subunit
LPKADNRRLGDVGWPLRDKNGFNRNAAEGLAVREFALPNGECDYLQVGF